MLFDYFYGCLVIFKIIKNGVIIVQVKTDKLIGIFKYLIRQEIKEQLLIKNKKNQLERFMEIMVDLQYLPYAPKIFRSIDETPYVLYWSYHFKFSEIYTVGLLQAFFKMSKILFNICYKPISHR